MKLGTLLFTSIAITTQLLSSEKIKEFHVKAGIPASEVFLNLESIIDSQTSLDISFLIAPGVSVRLSKEMTLRNLALGQIIQVLCSSMGLSSIETKNVYIIAEDDESRYEFSKTLRIADEDIAEVIDMIKEARSIIITKNEDSPKNDRTGIISEVLKGSSALSQDYRIGRAFPWNTERFGRRAVTHGDGMVIFLIDSLQKKMSFIPYDGEFLRKPKGMSLSELRIQIEACRVEPNDADKPVDSPEITQNRSDDRPI